MADNSKQSTNSDDNIILEDDQTDDEILQMLSEESSKIPANFEEIKLRDETFYACIVNYATISDSETIEFDAVYGDGKSNNDIRGIFFVGCEITKIPQGITKIFPNLEFMIIAKGQIEELRKEELAEYKNLKTFICDFNPLTTLSADLFEGFENLEVISICCQDLVKINPNILDGLKKLKEVDFYGNKGFENCRFIDSSLENDSELLTASNKNDSIDENTIKICSTLDELKDVLAEKFKEVESFEQRQLELENYEVKFFEIQEKHLQLEHDLSDLNGENAVLKGKNDELKSENSELQVQIKNLELKHEENLKQKEKETEEKIRKIIEDLTRNKHLEDDMKPNPDSFD